MTMQVIWQKSLMLLGLPGPQNSEVFEASAAGELR